MSATPAYGPVLLVDDDPDDRFLVEQSWKAAGRGRPLLTLPDGRQALDYLLGKGAYADRTLHPLPCLVLLDVKMPGLSGFEVLELLRHEEALLRLPVVILTASTSPQDAATARRLGADAFFIKPSSVQELIALLAQCGRYFDQPTR